MTLFLLEVALPLSVYEEVTPHLSGGRYYSILWMMTLPQE
jgi:hypothetical protein